MDGYAKIKDENVLKNWIAHEKEQDRAHSWAQTQWAEYFFHLQKEFEGAKHLVEHSSWSSIVTDRSGDFHNLLDALNKDGQRLQVFYSDETASSVGYQDNRYIIPTEFLEITPLKDYDALSSSEMALLGDLEMSSSLLPADITKDSVKSVKDSLEEEKTKIKAFEKEYELKVEELWKEMERKKQDLQEILEKQTAELKAKKAELEKKLLVLDTQIYSIRCYLGEVIDFTKIRDGKPAKEDTPVVVFQKFRYLDEELGKYLGLYAYDDKEGFLEILKYRDDLRDLFCPAERSISVLQISRTGTLKCPHEKVANMLADYEYLHSRQIAIMVRDGEILYMGWTDDDRIQLSNEDLFKKASMEIEQLPDEPEDSWHKDMQESMIKHAEEREQKDRISRFFLMSILQGMVDNKNMLKFPEKVRMTEESDYVKFSYAEGWLKDNRFGSFEDMLEKVKDVPTRKGESILTAMHIRRDRDYGFYGNRNTEYAAYNNDRGIGEKNRTHGAYIPGMKLMPINKVLKSGRAVVHYRKHKPKLVKKNGIYFEVAKNGDNGVYDIVPDGLISGKEYTLECKLAPDDFYRADSPLAAVKSKFSHHMLWSDKDPESHKLSHERRRIELTSGLFVPEFVNVDFEQDDIRVYVSVPMETAKYNGTNARCNFEIAENEYIRADYLCSTWLRYVITTGNIGYFCLCGSKMNYADSLKYLNTLLEAVKEREDKEKKFLDNAWLENTPEWDRILCEWKIANHIPVLTKRSATQFKKKMEEKADE